MMDPALLYKIRTDSIQTDLTAISSLCDGETILEVGAGAGRIIKALANLKQAAVIIGVESDGGLVDLARSDDAIRNDPRISIIHADFLDYSPPAQVSRVLFSFNVICEFLDPRSRIEALRHASRCLTGDGRIIVFAPLHDFEAFADRETEHRFSIRDFDGQSWTTTIRCRRDHFNQVSHCVVTYVRDADGHAVESRYSNALITRNELLASYEAADLVLLKEYTSYDLGEGVAKECLIHVVSKRIGIRSMDPAQGEESFGSARGDGLTYRFPA